MMMHCKPGLALFVPLKEWELGDPQEVVLSFRNQLELFAQSQTQLTKSWQNNAVFVRYDEDNVALFAARVWSSALSSSSLMNLAKEQFGFSSAQRMNARPFAPIPFACSVSLSIAFLVRVDAAFFATMQRTEPPSAIAFANTGKLLSLTCSVRLIISIPNGYPACPNHSVPLLC